MSPNFTSLPRSEIARICQFADANTTRILREISKEIKEIIEETQQIVIDSFGFSEEEEKPGIRTHFYFKNPWYCISFRNILISAFEKLKISITLPGDMSLILEFNLKPDDLIRVLKHLTPLIRDHTFLELNGWNQDPQILRTCSIFLKGKCIPRVVIGVFTTEPVDYDLHLTIVKQVMPVHVNLVFINRTLDKDSLRFVSKLADMVKSFRLWVEPRMAWPSPRIISIILPLLRQNCENLEFIFDCPDNTISFADIELLLQRLHHSEKKVSVSSLRSEESMDAQIGVYKLSTIGRLVELKHLEFHSTTF